METALKQQFEEIGIEPTQEIIDKSFELCTMHHIEDASEFVEQWLAFSLSHLDAAEPTIEHLLEFERKVLQTKRDKQEVGHLCTHHNTLPDLPSANYLNDHDLCAVVEDVEYDNKLEDYMWGVGTAKPKREVYINKLLLRSNDDLALICGIMLRNQEIKKGGRLNSTTAQVVNCNGFNATRGATYSDAKCSASSLATPASAGTPRTHLASQGSGKIVYTFGNPTLINNAAWSHHGHEENIKLKQLLEHNGQTLQAQTKYMFDDLYEKAELTADRIFIIGRGLCHKVFGENVDDFDLGQPDIRSQNTIRAVGTIHSDDYESALDERSTLFVNSDNMKLRTVRLNFAEIKSVALFPGQIVMVSGVNPRGGVFLVKEILAEQNVQPPTLPRLKQPLSFVVAAGPYTHPDDLAYEPLHDLLAYLKDQTPHVLILTGPFVEANHKLIASGTLTESFEIFFEKIITSIMEAVGVNTTVLIVASHCDVHADSVYPTMPLSIRQTYANLHMLPDPSMVDLNGLVIGITSTDIVDHISSQELAVNAGDKPKRIVNYLIHQKSFYPLVPPKEDAMCFDTQLADAFAQLNRIPNILILPSDQKCFIRVVNGCLAINPGRLQSDKVGTFARFIVNPTETEVENNAYNYIGCQICKVF